jgi:hypothetical protein
MAGMFGMEMAPYMGIRAALGMRSTLTEDDLGPLEKQAIADVIKKAQAANRDHVTYVDYDRKDPLQYQIENSLGQFNFSTDAEGNYKVEDNYDFMNDVREADVLKYRNNDLLSNILDFRMAIPETLMKAYDQTKDRDDVRFLDQSLFRLGEEYGNRFLNDIVFPVDVTLPKGMFK